MIAGIFHQGSGLGNQLFRYIATRVLAKDKGYEFGMVAPELFKGKDFMKLDMGKDTELVYGVEPATGKVTPFIRELNRLNPKIWEEGTFYYNPDINFIEDDTVIDGNLEDPRYFEHRLGEIDEWLKVEPMKFWGNECVIGFRGGEFKAVPELFLPKSYWDEAIAKMRGINPNMKFEVHTDDPVTAKEFFPDFPITQNVGINWRSMRYAKYAIIANSSFFIMPRLLNGGLTIAPKYWNRYNTKRWDYPQNFYKQFTYI